MCLVAFSKTPHYSALKKLENFEGRPRWAYIVITEKCSHACPWCYGEYNKGGTGEMSLENFRLLLEKLKNMNVAQITLSGGEPTEHPHFEEFIHLCKDFHTHIASHGEHIDSSMSALLAENGVRQVQFNYQGKAHHDRVHRMDSYESQLEAIRHMLAHGIEVAATVTVGKYNFSAIGEIFREVADLGVTRLRVWDATGVGKKFCDGLEVAEIFARCRREAAALGYVHCLSYDPSFEGDITIPCLQLAGLYMYVDAACRLRFCGAVKKGPLIADMLVDSPEAILNKYLAVNQGILKGYRPWCVARYDDLEPHDQD